MLPNFPFRSAMKWWDQILVFLILVWRRKWQPTPVFLSRESQGQRSLGGLQSMGSQRVGHDWSELACVLGNEKGKYPLRHPIPVQVLRSGAQGRHSWTDVQCGHHESLKHCISELREKSAWGLPCGAQSASWFLSSWKGDPRSDHEQWSQSPGGNPMLSTGWGPALRSPSLDPAQSRPAAGAELCTGCSSRCTPSPSYPPSSKRLYFSLEFPKFSYCCDTWQALTVLVEDPHVSNSLLTVTNPCQFQTDNFYLC